MRIFNAGGFFRPLGKKWQSLVANPPERNKVYSTITITNENGIGKLKFATKIDKFLYISLDDTSKVVVKGENLNKCSEI